MIEGVLAAFGIIGIIIGSFAYSFFSKSKKQARIIQKELTDILNNPNYKVRGKYE